MTEIKSETTGTIRIADEVLAHIAGTATMEVDGVVGLTTRNKSRGVNIAVKNNHVTVGLTISVRLGKKLQAVSRAVQERVKTAIEMMTTLTVAEVNVCVGALINDKPRKG